MPGDTFSIEGNEAERQEGARFRDRRLPHRQGQGAGCGRQRHAQGILVTIGDVNEAPEKVFLSKTIISENAEVGTRVGVLSAFDPEGGAVTYRLKGNPGSLLQALRRQAHPGEGPRLREGTESHDHGPGHGLHRPDDTSRRSRSTSVDVVESKVRHRPQRRAHRQHRPGQAVRRRRLSTSSSAMAATITSMAAATTTS